MANDDRDPFDDLDDEYTVDFRDPPFVRDSETSRNAAKGIKRHRGGIAYSIFLHMSGLKQGATCHEVVRDLGFKHQTASPRFNELAEAKVIRLTGEKRSTDAAEAEVYEVVPKASFDLYVECMRRKRANSKSDKDALKAAVLERAEAFARAFDEPHADVEACAKALLDAARKAF